MIQSKITVGNQYGLAKSTSEWDTSARSLTPITVLKKNVVAFKKVHSSGSFYGSTSECKAIRVRNDSDREVFVQAVKPDNKRDTHAPNKLAPGQDCLVEARLIFDIEEKQSAADAAARRQAEADARQEESKRVAEEAAALLQAAGFHATTRYHHTPNTRNGRFTVELNPTTALSLGNAVTA